MTAQIPDVVILDGRRCPLPSAPSPFPPGFDLPPGQFFSGADHRNVRGYGAVWQIVDGRLLVVGFGGTVEAFPGGDRQIGMREVYGTEGPVWAEWVSRTLVIPVGEPVHDPEGFRAPTSTASCEVQVVHGRVTGMTTRAVADRPVA
jgi:hypothetical protein